MNQHFGLIRKDVNSLKGQFRAKDNTAKHTYKYLKETIQFMVERVNMIENRNDLFEKKMEVNHLEVISEISRVSDASVKPEDDRKDLHSIFHLKVNNQKIKT